LYIYYKKLKEYINAGNENNLSPEELERKIREIKAERKELRVKIETYQREFENTNNRRIKYERDIAQIKT
jgi:ribosomal protein L29